MGEKNPSELIGSAIRGIESFLTARGHSCRPLPRPRGGGSVDPMKAIQNTIDIIERILGKRK